MVETKVQRVILLPRYSSFSGATLFRVPPIYVRPYGDVVVHAWRATGMGVGTMSLTIEQSVDLETWHTLDVLTLAADTEASTGLELTDDWLRVTAQLTGTDPSTTCWALADLVQRDTHGGA